MKICPFISHLLGDEDSNTLTLNNGTGDSHEAANPNDVVILGYNDDDGSSVQTDVMTRTETDRQTASHVECLKESCRFFHTENQECRFDVIFSRLDQAKPSEGEESRISDLAKDIDKIWNFQTRGVAEIVGSLADSDKNQSQALEALKKTFDKRIETLGSGMDESSLERIQEQINSLRERLEARDNELESLSNTISGVVSSLDRGVSEIKVMSDDVSKRVMELKDSFPDASSLKNMLEEAFDKTENNFTAFDITTPIKALEHKIEDLQKSQEDSTTGMEKKILTSIQNQKELEGRIEAWKGELDAATSELKSRHDDWESQITELANNNKKIFGYIEEGEKHREEAQSRQGKKEAKKYNNLGVTSFHNGAYEMARDQFLRAVDLDSEFAEAYNNLGLAYTELEAEEKATEAFGRAIELNPSLHAAYNNLGYIHYKLGEYEQAIEQYNEALGRNTKNGPAYTNLGNAYYKLDRIDEARDAWTKALELDPGNEKARRNLERISEDNE
jgi:tetratricopeptide (TPR) repeat protein